MRDPSGSDRTFGFSGTYSSSNFAPPLFLSLQADNEEAMKDWVKDIEETAVTVVPVLGGQGGGGDASASGAAPVAARKVSQSENIFKLVEQKPHFVLYWMNLL